MIERYNLRIGNDLIDWIEHLIPREDFQSSETTFHIDDVVNSEIIEAITIILQKFGHTDINKRISASTSSVLALNYIQSQNIIDNIFFESNSKYNSHLQEKFYHSSHNKKTNIFNLKSVLYFRIVNKIIYFSIFVAYEPIQWI